MSKASMGDGTRLVEDHRADLPRNGNPACRASLEIETQVVGRLCLEGAQLLPNLKRAPWVPRPKYTTQKSAS